MGGMLVAVDLKAWRSVVGTTEDRAPLGLALKWGTPLVNGVAITAGGLVFTGAMDAYLRAFDAKSGAELWQGRLPVPGIANPMTYFGRANNMSSSQLVATRRPAPPSAMPWSPSA